MADHNLLVLLGPTPNSYFLTYGRQLRWNNAPDDLVQTFKKGGDMHPMSVGWISVHPNFKLWAAKNKSNHNLWFHNAMPQELAQFINGPVKPSFISWCDDSKGYFVKLRDIPQWTLDIRDDYPQKLYEICKAVPDFERGLKAVIFGHKGTHIYIFERGFWAALEGPAEKPEHPLYKVLMEFTKKGGYDLLESSHLSLHDDQHFMLKFQKQGSNTIEMRWNLPTPAGKALQELMQLSETPEEKKYMTEWNSNNNTQGMLAANAAFAGALQNQITLNQVFFKPYYQI